MASIYTTSRLILLSKRFATNWAGRSKQRHPFLVRTATTRSNYEPTFETKRLPMSSLLKDDPRNDATGKENKPVDIVLLLKKILQLDTLKKAQQIVLKYQSFLGTSLDQVRTTAEFLETKGITGIDLQRDPWLLLMDPETMNEKAATLKAQLKIHDFRTAAPLFQLPVLKILRLRSLWKNEIIALENQDALQPVLNRSRFSNRIEILSFRLKCESHEVSQMMRRTPVLMSSTLSSIEAKIVCMLENGIAPEDIVKDPFIFTNVLQNIESKLSLCKENGLTTVKPWMLRCTPLAFQSYLQRTTEESELRSGHNDIASFLANSLQCSTSTASEILRRVPSIRNSSAIRMNEMIQFLLSQGFTNEQILQVPRILAHKVETVEARITKLLPYGHKPMSLMALCYTTQEFEAFLRKLSKPSDKKIHQQQSRTC